MRKLFLLGSLIALLVPTASRAQFQLGLRLGYAPSMGNAAEESGESLKMKDVSLKSQIPIQVEGSYKLSKDLAAGLYFSYGFGQTDAGLGEALVGTNLCDQSGVDCSGSSFRVGVQGLYSFSSVSAPLVPWVGVGLGYESTTTKMKAPGGEVTIDLNGFELALQAGGDYRVTDQFSVGPYVMLSIAQFQNGEIEANGTTFASGSIEDKTLHQWFGFGVAGKFDL